MNKKFVKETIEVTPKNLRCIAAACPSIFKTDEGKYIVVGRKLLEEELIEKIKDKIGEGEIAVEIPQDLFSGL